MAENNNMARFPSTVDITPEHSTKKLGRSRQWLVHLLMIGIPILLCIILVVVLVALPAPKEETVSTKCLPSEESKSSGLFDILNKIQHTYFHTLKTELIYMKTGATPEEIRTVFRPYDPTPSAIKNRTDEAAKLLRELNALTINTTLLKMRERKAVYVARAILKNNYGWAPYTQDYYTGDWLLGPDMYCWQPICEVFLHLGGVISFFKPHNLKELERLKGLLEKHNQTFQRYIENVKRGVRSGYVRPIEACKSGLHNLNYVNYRSIAIGNETGIYDEPFSKVLASPDFFEHVSADDNKTWAKLYDVGVETYFNQSLLLNVGRPAMEMLRYLNQEHIRNCVPTSLASGLQKLPIPYTYIDGTPDTSKATNQTLPNGEQLRGSHTYELLMPFFTTLDIKPVQLRKKAVNRLELLYKEAVEIAKLYTGLPDNRTAIDKFSKEIQAHTSDMWFNSEPFPRNESGDEAFVKCHDVESAKAYCPKRWKAMEDWIQNTVETMKIIRPTIGTMFYEDGPKKTVPTCPIDVVPWFHPHGAFHAYIIGTKDCEFKATQGLPFFVEWFGPKWTEYTTTAHEQLPGHHLEVQSYTEYFADDCGDSITWLGAYNFFTGITEGWATYVEYKLLPLDTKIYSSFDKKILLQKYGMIYYQMLAAIRAIVDIDLHYTGTTMEEVLKRYKDYVWEDNNHQVQKDITRMQSAPGYVTSYMIGEMEISRVRDITEQELGRDFSLKDFHYEVLRQGEYPLDYLEEHIRAYIACKKDPSGVGCEEMS